MTAEFAVILPVFVVLMTAILAAAIVGVAQLRCVDAARVAARLAARSESLASVVAAAGAVAPAGAGVRVGRVGDDVRVSVTAQVGLPLPGRPVVGVRAASTARLEASS